MARGMQPESFEDLAPEARIGDFSGPPAPAAQCPQRRLSERFSASFVFATKRGGAGSKNVQRAEGARSSSYAKVSIWFPYCHIFAASGKLFLFNTPPDGGGRGEQNLRKTWLCRRGRLAGDDVDRRRFEGGGDFFSLLQQEPLEGLASHISHQIEAAIHINPMK